MESLSLDLNYACNLSCTTCRCPQIDNAIGSPQMTLPAAIKVIDDFVALGGTKVYIFGGEPLLVPHIYDLVDYVKSKKLYAALTTNGILLTERNAQRLMATGVDQVTVSLDGDRQGHEAIRGPRSFDATVRGAANLADAAARLRRDRFKLNLGVTISRANVGSFANVILAAAEMGKGVSVCVYHFSMIPEDDTLATERALGKTSDPRRNHWRLPADLLLTSEDIPTLRSSLKHFKNLAAIYDVDISVDPAIDLALDHELLVSGEYRLQKTCGVFDNSILVGPDGEVGACPMLTHFSFANLKQAPLHEIWSEGGAFDTVRSILREGYLPVCKRCCRHAELM